MVGQMPTPFRIENKIIFIIMLISNFYFAISVNGKHKLISIKQLPAKEGFITVFKDGIYIYSNDLIKNTKIYEFKESLNTKKDEVEIIFEKFKYKDNEYYSWITKRFILIYNSLNKNITSYDLNIEYNLETFNMDIDGSKLYLLSIKKDSENTKIIAHSYYLNENSKNMKLIGEKEIYLFNDSFSKIKLNFLADKYNNLVKCFYYKNNLGIIELYLNEDNNKIIKEKIIEDIKINIKKNEKINKIKSVILKSNNYLICFLFEDNSSKCFINNNNEFILVQCLNQFKCKDIKIDFFEENDVYIFVCQREKEIVLKIFKYLNSHSQMIFSERKFLIKNDENSFSIIYDKIINEYKIISSSNFSFPTNIRHLESKENSIDFTDEIYSNSISKELYRESETTSEFSESNKVIDTNTNSENKLPDSNGITSGENESDNTNERIENSSDIKILEDENIQTTETSNSHTYESSESSKSTYHTADFNKKEKNEFMTDYSNSISTDKIISTSTISTKYSNSEIISDSSISTNGPILVNFSSDLNKNINLDSTSNFIAKSTDNNYIEKSDEKNSSEVIYDSSEEISTYNLDKSSEILYESYSNSITKDEENEIQTNSISNNKENTEAINSGNLFKSSVIINDNELKYSSIMTEDSTESLQETSYLTSNINKDEFNQQTDNTNDLSTNEIRHTSDKISDSFENLSDNNVSENKKQYESSIITDSIGNTKDNIKSSDSTYKTSINSITNINNKTDNVNEENSFYSSLITTENDSRYISEIISDSTNKKYTTKEIYQESTDLTTNIDNFSSTELNSYSNINDKRKEGSTYIENDSTIINKNDNNEEFSTNLGSTDTFPTSSEPLDNNLASNSILNINENKLDKITEISDISTNKNTKENNLDFSSEAITNSNSYINIDKDETDSKEISTNEEINEGSENINNSNDNYLKDSNSIAYDNSINSNSVTNIKTTNQEIIVYSSNEIISDSNNKGDEIMQSTTDFYSDINKISNSISQTTNEYKTSDIIENSSENLSNSNKKIDNDFSDLTSKTILHKNLFE